MTKKLLSFISLSIGFLGISRWGDTTNYSNVLKVLYSPKKVMDNYSKLKAASINPW